MERITAPDGVDIVVHSSGTGPGVALRAAFRLPVDRPARYDPAISIAPA
jgi:hypothetical protein